MRKKSFTAPFWFLLVLGILELLVVSFYVSVTLKYSNGYTHASHPRINLLRTFMWPLIFLIEAFVYWYIRRRNSYRLLSWAHVGTLLFAFFVNLLLVMSGILHDDFVSGANRRGDRQADIQLQFHLFWIFIGIAHCFFVWLIVNCFRKKVPVAEEKEDGKNLLDDVLV